MAKVTNEQKRNMVDQLYGLRHTVALAYGNTDTKEPDSAAYAQALGHLAEAQKALNRIPH